MTMFSLSSSSSHTRNPAIDSLRAFVVLLVITHHAILAYFAYAPPLGAFDGSIGWGAFPVIDTARGPGLDVLVLWNDSFFMALMFLLSGLFVGPSLARKGVGGFVRDRFIRLGVPFVFGALVIAPLAYYPAWLLRADATDAAGFWDAWLKLGSWPAGPAWFLWVLLAFGVVAALVYRLLPALLNVLGSLGAWLWERPTLTAAALMLVATAAYVPLVQVVDPSHWTAWGPFYVQTCRILLYAVYFAFGIALGAHGEVGRVFVAPDGCLARGWIAWQTVAGVVFAAFVIVLVISITRATKGEPSLAFNVAAASLFAATGVASSFALLSTFARKCNKRSAIWASLGRNAFGMYVIHYAIVSWLQYGMLSAELPGLVKALLVTITAIALSWAGASALRRVPVVARVL